MGEPSSFSPSLQICLDRSGFRSGGAFSKPAITSSVPNDRAARVWISTVKHFSSSATCACAVHWTRLCYDTTRGHSGPLVQERRRLLPRRRELHGQQR